MESGNMCEKSPLSVLDFLGRGTPGWNKARSRCGAASPQNNSEQGGRGEERSTAFCGAQDLPTSGVLDQASTQHSRRNGRKLPKLPNIDDTLDQTKVLMATSAALLRRTPSVMSPNLFAFEDHFSFEAVIGRSPLSEVYRARHRGTGQLYAVKRSMRRFRSKGDRDRSLHEIQAVASLPSHPHVVTLHRAWQQRGHFYIQMDLAENGSLGSILRQRQQEGQLLPETVVWQVLWEVAQGLEFLHAHEVIVMDIKPDNVFCNRNGTFQIGDFGLAVVGSTQRDWEEGDGDYLAPELLSDDKPSPAADIYSLGATIYECATGMKLPRSRQDCNGRDLELPGRLPALQQLVQGMLSRNPASRLSAQELVQQVGSLQLPFGLSAPVSARSSFGDAQPSAAADPGPFSQDAFSTPAHRHLARNLPGTGGSSVTATCSSGPTPLPRRLNLAQLPSLTLPDAPSPSAVSTPVMCGAGWRRTLSSNDMSHDGAEVGTPTRPPSFGPPQLQQRLSVSSPTLLSPFSEAGCSPFSTPAQGRRPSTAATPSFTGSTAFVYHSRWARECSFDRSEAAAQVRPFCLEPDDMDGSPSFQLDEDLPGSRAEGGTCSADILCLDDQEPFDSAADEEASPQQLSRDCSMGLHDDDILDERQATDSSSLLHHNRSFARLSLSGAQSESACTAAASHRGQEQQPIPSPFASQRAQHAIPGADQHWGPLTAQLSKGFSMSRMDTLKEEKSLPFVCAC